MSETPGKAISEQPLCSIVIPVHNRVDLTRQCLAAVRQNTSAVSYDVVLVDDGSTDGTAEFLAGLEPPFRSITNDGNLGFARSCNAGAWATDGEYILFLNNDTVPLPGWLPPMIKCMEERSRVSIVGSKLLYPENDLIQHAGVALGKNKDPYHIYRCLPSDIPEVDVERECQAVTAACFLVRRSLFKALNGFDAVFRNGLEDVDFCLRVRERGYKVWYCPSSVLYHHESMSPGRLDGQELNVVTYYKRWAGKVKPDPEFPRHLLARIGSPLLKVNTRGNKFVMFRGRKLYVCDHHRSETRTYSNGFLYALARFCYGIRYCRYRNRIRQLEREAIREEERGASVTSEEERSSDQFWHPSDASQTSIQASKSKESAHFDEPLGDMNLKSQPAPATILVLGMHRSGTSMIARLVNLCGAYIAEPSEVMEPSPDNPAGYWEPKQLVNINQNVLKHMNCSWYSPPLQAVSSSFEELDPAVVSDMNGFLSDGVPKDRPRVLKDPRMSVLLPLWRALLPRPVALIVWRNPINVAKSLQVRNGFPTSVSYALWEQYTRSAIEVSDGMPRMLVSFDRFISEPKSSIEMLIEFLAEHAGTTAENVEFERLLSVASLDVVHHRSPVSAFFEDPNSSRSQRELLRRLEASGTLVDGAELSFNMDPVSICREDLYGLVQKSDDMARRLDGMSQQLLEAIRHAQHCTEGIMDRYRASHWFLHRVGLRKLARWLYERWGPGKDKPSQPPEQTSQ